MGPFLRLDWLQVFLKGCYRWMRRQGEAGVTEDVCLQMDLTGWEGGQHLQELGRLKSVGCE